MSDFTAEMNPFTAEQHVGRSSVELAITRESAQVTNVLSSNRERHGACRRQTFQCAKYYHGATYYSLILQSNAARSLVTPRRRIIVLMLLTRTDVIFLCIFSRKNKNKDKNRPEETSK